MLERLYVHNFRCLENFEFLPGEASSVLLIGKNGSGKSTLAKALAVFQAIGRGTNRVGDLVKPADCTQGRTTNPMRFELSVRLGAHLFGYALAFELPAGFRELRVKEETLTLDGGVVYTRQQAQVKLLRSRPGATVGTEETSFNIDWHLVALMVVQDPAVSGALGAFREWLSRIVLLAPLPPLMQGEARSETLQPAADGSDFTAWLTGVLAQFPAAYSGISQHLQQVMPDLYQFRNEPTGRDAKALMVEFRSGQHRMTLPFEALSDGEKCYFLCAVLIAANEAYGPLLAFWDEPDNHLMLSEVRHFAMALRRAFRSQGQVLLTSHNAEIIRSFSDDNTWVLQRPSHQDPTVLRRLADLNVAGDLVEAVLTGELAA